ncbi:unnamed protein product [Lactuca saligna]|uniref:Uncharacterized protein n=1 Tax=Lactuca saligna TaxID=75948 RepID=A0AA36E3N8_LACSI|nr:unnamed protein product [Lactuca saligna]
MVDLCFSIYPYAKLHALLFVTIFLIAFGGLVLYTVSDGSLAEALWISWTFVADSGNHAGRVGTGSRIVSVTISSGGMLIFAMMLGLVSDAISKKGSLLKQLAIANKSIGGGVVVVLAESDKEEMEMDIAKLEFNFMGTLVICRSGSPLILADLKKLSVSKARAIIVLAADENADQEDEEMLICGNESGSIRCGVVMASQSLQLWGRVTELLVAHFIWLDYNYPAKPIYLYINSSGTQNDKMETVRSETEAYAIVDIMAYCKSVVYAVNCGMAFGQLSFLSYALNIGCI